MMHSYPWYTSDWRKSEAVLAMNLEEKGLYREMLDHTWEQGSLPVDESLLQKIAGASTWEWKRSWPKVRAQFYEKDGRLYHAKVDEKRPDIQRWHNDRREAGRKGGLRKAANQRPVENPSSATAPLESVSKPSSSSTSSTSSTKEEQPPTPCICASDDAQEREPEFALAPVLFAVAPKAGNGNGNHPEWFVQWWAIYWRKVSKQPAEKAFRAHVKTEARFAEVMAATKTQTAAMMARVPDYRPLGATWLNAERWNDEPSLPARVSPVQDRGFVASVQRVIGERIAKDGKPWGTLRRWRNI